MSNCRQASEVVLSYGPWRRTVQYCNEADAQDRFGMVIMTLEHSHHVNDGVVTRFGESFGSPLSVTPTQLFLKVPEPVPRVPAFVYTVPETCVYRLATSPLQRLSLSASGAVESAAHAGVAQKYADSVAFRSVATSVRSARCCDAMC
jgi:hypothetical protein